MPLSETSDLGKTFKEYFEIVPAYSDALKDEVYRIRHQVYCEELAFEPQRPDKRERDEYDAHSLHVLLRSVHLDKYVGCMRLVRARPEDPDYPLPFEKSCAATLDRSIVDPAKLPRDTIAEGSRLAVIALFRQRKGEANSPLGLQEHSGTPAQPRFAYIPVALHYGVIELARVNGIDALFALAEDRLANYYNRVGITNQRIGGAIELHGQRFPVILRPTGIINNLSDEYRPLYRIIAAEIAQRTDSDPSVDSVATST